MKKKTIIIVSVIAVLAGLTFVPVVGINPDPKTGASTDNVSIFHYLLIQTGLGS